MSVSPLLGKHHMVVAHSHFKLASHWICVRGFEQGAAWSGELIPKNPIIEMPRKIL